MHTNDVVWSQREQFTSSNIHFTVACLPPFLKAVLTYFCHMRDPVCVYMNKLKEQLWIYWPSQTHTLFLFLLIFIIPTQLSYHYYHYFMLYPSPSYEKSDDTHLWTGGSWPWERDHLFVCLYLNKLQNGKWYAIKTWTKKERGKAFFKLYHIFLLVKRDQLFSSHSLLNLVCTALTQL